MSTPVLATKLFAPSRRPQLVARPRLTDHLDATLDSGHGLTVVSAPAGFGKSTVLSDWRAELHERGSGTRVGWLSLDEGDNDLTRLLTHLVAALRSVGLGVGPAVLDSLHAAAVPTALTLLVNDVTAAGAQTPGEQWVVVLDDYHCIEAAEVHEAVAFLVDHLPEHLHLVLATRSDPPLPLARLRSRGQLVELRAAELRFTPAEAQAFLNRAMGLDLDDTAVRALEERTEGWIVGLQLAALSLRGIAERSDVGGFIEAFTGSNRFVIDYLVDEVLHRQPGEVREFLLDTSVLDRLTGPLCDAVTGTHDALRMLENLERSNLFLVPLDTERTWFRYHHLFADVLRARLRADAPERIPVLHRRASDWCASHGLVQDAVRHALAAEDFDRAALLVEQAVPELRRTRQDDLMLGWVRALPDPVVRRSPVLCVLAGWSLMLAGDLEGLEQRLDDADAALAAGARDEDLRAAWADTEDLRTAPATVSVYRASLAQARGDVAGTVRHARRAVELAGPEDHFVRGAGAGFLGLAAWAAGDLHEALSTFSMAVRSLHSAGNLVDELDSTVVLADMWVASGRPSRARRLCERALLRADEGGIPYLRAMADLHVALAELDLELDELTLAEQHLETARVLAERTSITENRHRWFVAMARLRAARGEYDAAQPLLDRASSLYRPGFYPDVRPIDAVTARVQICAGDLSTAAGWADERGVSVVDAPDYLHEYEHLTLARLLLAQHRAGARTSSGVAPVLGLLDRLHATAVAARRAGSVLEIRVLQGLAHHADGDQQRALGALTSAWAEAPEPDSHVRLHLDEGPPMLDLLRDVVRAGTDEALRERARGLLARAHAHGSDEDAERQQTLVDPLSQRELEVVRLLASELTGPEIARQLYVSLNTLRTHTKRIFTKLDARTRATAVQRAREHGLL